MTTLITDGFDPGDRVPCNCGNDGQPLESHDSMCAIVIDLQAEIAYWDWYFGDSE